MAATIRCPKCKTEQPKQPICSHCGFDIRAYALKLQQQKAGAETKGGPPPGTPAITCPRCKTRQPRQPICAKCGFDIRAYALKMKQKPAAQPQSPTAPPQKPATQPPTPAAQPSEQATQKPKPVPNFAALEALRKRVTEEASAPERLLSVTELFSQAWEVYKNRLGTLLALYALSIVFAAVPLVFFVGGGIGFALLVSEIKVFAISAGAVIGVTFSLVGMCWGLAAMTAGVVHKRLGVKEALGRGWHLLWPYIWLVSIAWYVITGGLLLMFIPGLIFLVWAFPSQFVLFAENERGMDALLKSREYVRGYWLDTFVKLFVIWLCMVAASMVPLGQLFFFPFMMIYLFKMFMNLRRIKGSVVVYSTSMKDKLIWLGTGTLGLVLPLVLVITLAGPSLKTSFSDIKRFIETGQLPIQEGFLPKGAVSKGLVTPLKNSYITGEPIIITYTGLPGNQRDWIALADTDSPDKLYGQRFFTQGKTSGRHMFSGLPPGTYELRVYFNWPEGGYIVQDRYRVTVTTLYPPS